MYLREAGIVEASRAAVGVSTTVQALVGRVIGSYRLVRVLGMGGMGAVYEAERADAQFHQKVAIKVVTEASQNPESLKRFHLERQALADLNHPNIVRVIDGGTMPGGVPYVVMDYIEGQRIDEYCDSRKLSVRQRIHLFLEVCAAAEYAHRHAVIHCDIKSANILVGTDGHPKLLDFGIAKLMRRDNAPINPEVTSKEIRPLTLDHASPEQLTGKPITTATDQYALAVTLYQILTGKLPYNIQSYSAPELVYRIAVEAPTPASQNISEARAAQDPKLSSELQGEVDAILLKALTKNSEQRYETVEKFADDLRNHLEHRPVSVMPRTKQYVAAKFVQRNQLASLIGGAAAVVLLLALISVGYATWRASVERDRAEQRLEDVHKLVNVLLSDVYNMAASLPGSTKLQQLILSRAIEYLDRLATDSGDDPTLQLNLIDAYLKFGDSQGNPNHQNLGDTAGAIKSYRKARTVADAALKARPTDVRLLRALAMTRQNMGEILPQMGKLNEAVEEQQEAVKAFEKIAAANQRSAGPQIDLAKGLEALADSLGNPNMVSLGKQQEALAKYRQSLQRWQTAMQLENNSPRTRRGAAGLLMKLGAIEGEAKDVDSARRDYTQAIQLLADIPDPDATSVEVKRLRASVYRGFGALLVENNDGKGGLDYLNQASDVLNTLAAADPKNERAKADVANLWLSMGDVSSRMGNNAAALDYYQKADAFYENALKADPDNKAYRNQTGYALWKIGIELNRKGQKADAARATLSAIERVTDLASKEDASPGELVRAATTLFSCEPPELRNLEAAKNYALRAEKMTEYKDTSIVNLMYRIRQAEERAK